MHIALTGNNMQLARCRDAYANVRLYDMYVRINESVCTFCLYMSDCLPNFYVVACTTFPWYPARNCNKIYTYYLR